jgi:putative ABC transport system substrate-binding protein
MRRREFISLMGGAAAAWPMAARAQQAAVPVVGFLGHGSPDVFAHLVRAFRQGLSETGYVEGRNVAIEYRWAQYDPARLPELAADLVRRRVAVIATPGSTPAALAAKAATTTIPIVFMIGLDPVQMGLVTSLNRPGGNLTGFAEMNSEIATKRLGLLHELLPKAARFALLLEASTPIIPSDIANLHTAAAAIARQFEVLSVVAAPRDLDAAFATILQNRIDGVLVSPSALFHGLHAHLAMLATRHAIPAIYWMREFVDAGGLMSYGTNLADQHRQVGIYTGRILKGEKPADLPVVQPTKIELVINAKVAKALGLEIPPKLLAIADEVIE